ncbi:type VI secretion system membrane subunit TssM [Defluviimonas aestuarii]|uniref:type VI secretion system membrane subunit TssM n=1 Tax=Albidovulum aestuarii TaxID=1130726 RepID=UPI00249BD7B8|nr:type VI secretion system membrane subunit TssM [Defluviimonas aestuarii]MDI3337739.1 type VI secretion system membrane subunit TssM [Defluviimonas aestuarii]
MRFLKAIFGFLISRRFWTFVGIVLLCALIWLFGPLIAVGEAVPLASDLTRMIVIGVIVLFWLISILIGLLRAARRNRMFVADLAAPEPVAEPKPGEANVAEVNTRFQSVLAEMKRSKLGSRKFLRDMPWYLMIGPPGTGKTTALRQSGLHFPIDLSDDIKGVGGTRNCDWFFTDEAVLVDTAGRYVQQASDPGVDAAEWDGFLAMLKKHRGRRALNGVIVALSMRELLGSAEELQTHGREIRRRLSELREKLGLHLPVYLMVTKCDLVPGFEPFFADLSTRDREQVWGATFGTEARVDGVAVEREVKALMATAEARLSARMAGDAALPERAETFRFPAQMAAVEGPLKSLINTVFGESRYEESPWLRGFYFTSATQEGSPIDRLVGELSSAFGLSAEPPKPRRFGETRSYFLRDLLAEVIFSEAGLGLFDRAAEERRKWLWRGSVAGAALVTSVAGLAFLFSFLRYSGAINDQERLIADLSGRLSNVAARQAPTDPLDLDIALDAINAVATARTEVPASFLTALGPTAEAELAEAQRIAFDRAARNIVEPRLVAVLEATMWRHVRDPEFLLGALKTYFMMTGMAPYDRDYVASWWQEALPEAAAIDLFPTDAALDHQLSAIDRLAGEETKIAPDPDLMNAALQSICTIPLSVRAYGALRQDPAVAALTDWIPAEKAGPNAPQVLTRLSQQTLRVGLPGAFTYRGFHDVVLPLIPEVAAQAALDRAVFAGGCAESSDASVATLEADILKLYSDDFIAQWDGLLRDLRLAPITDLRIATANLKDLASADSTLKRLLRAVVEETDLTRVEEDGGSGGGVPKGVISKAASKLGKVGKLAKKGAKLVALGKSGGAEVLPGAVIAGHFAPLKAVIIETDGVPPLIGDAELAIGALANELQTVAASPDPEAALLARGGLPELTGQVANVAATLPDPVDDWIRGIAGETIAVTREAVIAQLNARWRADVLPFCTSATAGRYPFVAGSAIDVNVADFQRLFGPGGLVDAFTNELLLPYIDTTRRPWTWRADFGLDAATLTPFEQARAIRDGLFPGGAGPIMAFTLEPKDLSANASRVTLNVDGQTLVYFNSATRPTPMTWPGPDGTNLISLSFAPIEGSAELIASEAGAWAWLRMIRGGNLRRTDLPELFRLTLAHGGYRAEFELRANSVDNPFDLTMFGNFRCPERF